MCFCHVLCLCVTRPVPCVYLVCVCAGQLARLQVDMESLRDQREKTICSTREELSLAQEEVQTSTHCTHIYTRTHMYTHTCTHTHGMYIRRTHTTQNVQFARTQHAHATRNHDMNTTWLQDTPTITRTRNLQEHHTHTQTHTNADTRDKTRSDNIV